MQCLDFGIRLTSPDGWHAAFFKIVKPHVTPATIIMSTIPIDSSDGNFARRTTDRLGAGDAFAAIQVYDPDPTFGSSRYEKVDSFRGFSFRLQDYQPFAAQGISKYKLSVTRSVVTNGRLVDILGVFGNRNPSLVQVQAISNAISTLRVLPDSAKEAAGNGVVEDRTPTHA